MESRARSSGRRSCQREMRTWPRGQDQLLGGQAKVEGVCGRGEERGEAMGRREAPDKHEKMAVHI